MKNTSSLSLIILLATLFINPTHTLVDSISAPKTVIHPGEKFTFTFHTSEYIPSNSMPSSESQSHLGLPVPAVRPTPSADGGTEGGVDLYKVGFSNLGSGEFKVTLRLPDSLSPRKTTKYTLQTGVLGTVSKKPA